MRFRLSSTSYSCNISKNLLNFGKGKKSVMISRLAQTISETAHLVSWSECAVVREYQISLRKSESFCRSQDNSQLRPSHSRGEQRRY